MQLNSNTLTTSKPNRMKMLSKTTLSEVRLSVGLMILIELTILIDGSQGSNVRDIVEPHKPDYEHIFYNEPQIPSRQRRAQNSGEDLGSDFFSHQGDEHPASGLSHQRFDENEFNGLSHSTIDDEHQIVSEAYGETMLSNINETAHMTTSINRVEQTDNNQDKKLFLTRELIDRTCRLDRGSERIEQLNNTFLTYCSRYKLENLFSNEILMYIMHHNSRECEKTLDEFVQLDETINQFDSLFIKLLSRYNCHNGYSVKWNCDDCKKSYKDWLCSTHLPFYMNGERIKPCISFCERVEQRCPYLHPITREQYGGQPVFICRDPNIPFVPAITPDIPSSEPGKCYDLCHLSENVTELRIDSLSKYDFDKCPDRSSLAGEVRNEQLTVSGQQNGSGFPQLVDSGDYPDLYPEENAVVIANRTNSQGQTKVLLAHSERKTAHVHIKKLEELREVLANYKNQAKTHRYHADHSSVDHSRSQHELHSS